MPQPARVLMPLDEGWRFLPDPDGLNEALGFPKNGLPAEARPVRLPHTWNAEAGTESFVGRGWYARELEIPAAWADRMVRIAFGAVYRDAVVWINGTRVAEHVGSGYTPFAVDATPYLHPGGANLLVVAVDNSFSHYALPYLRAFDWANDGGIIRPVVAIVTDRQAVDFVHVTATPHLIGPGRARGGRVDICFGLTEPRAEDLEGLRLRLSIVELGGGSPVWADERPITVEDGAGALDGIELPEVRLWHFDHPHLYALRLSLLRDGREMDEVETRFGFRNIRLDGARIVLNGEPVRLMGVEWMPGADPDVGMAEGERQIETALREMKDAGCVLTRFHWQQDERVLDWCDRHGMLVQEEIPLWGHPKEPGGVAMEVARHQAHAMIRQHFNHPSIVAWGMGNELDGQSAITWDFMTRLRAFVRELDDTRLANYVSNTLHIDPAHDATAVGDVMMWNAYAGTWLPDLDLAATLERVRSAWPDKPLVISEFGLCEPAHPGGDPRRIAMLREQLPVIGAAPTVTGAIYFSLNDYRTHMGEEGEGRFRQRVHGVTDLVGEPKPSYAVLQELSAPLQLTEVRRLGPTRFGLTVRANGPEQFPSYRLSGYRLTWAPMDGERSWHEADPVEVDLPDLRPNAVATVEVDDGVAAERIRVRIVRPTGERVLEVILPVVGEGAMGASAG